MPEEDTITQNQAEIQEHPFSVEKAFDTEHPATVVLVDITGYGSLNPRDTKDRLTRKYAPLFGNSGMLTTRPRSDDIYEDISMSHIADEIDFGVSDEDENFARRMQQMKKEEAEFMARMLFSPTTDITEIQSRQAILGQLAELPNLDELIRLKNDSYKVLIGAWNLVAVPGNGAFDEEPLIDRYRHDEKVVNIYEDEYSDVVVEELEVQDLVDEAVDQIDQGINSLQELINLVSLQDNPFVKAIFVDIARSLFTMQTEIKYVVPFDDSYGGLLPFTKFQSDGMPIIEGLYEYLNRELEPYFFRTGSILEFAKKIRDENWGIASFNPEQPIGYTQGWNLEKPKYSQVQNDSPEDASVVVLSGANTSGKSFTMKSDLLIRIAAQSLGFAPIQHGNFRPYESFVYLDRSSTTNELSAFMHEVQNWKSIFPLIGAHSRLYVDEGYSTTSPDDQANLLVATARYVKGKGGDVLLATHNDMVLSYADAIDMKTYHLAADVGKSGELVRHFHLEPGRSESYSFAVARMKNFPKRVLNWAESYLFKDSALPTPLVTDRYPAVEQLSGEERESRKKEVRSLDHIFPTEPGNNLFHLFSVDKDFQVKSLLGYLSYDRVAEVLDLNSELQGAIKGVETLFNKVSIDKQKELLGRMVLWVPEMSSAEVLERQRLMRELLNGGNYKMIHEAILSALALDGTFHDLKKSKMGRLNFELNPFDRSRSKVSSENNKEDAGNPPFFVDGLKAAIAFLRIQEKLSGQDFLFSEMLNRFVVLDNVYEQVMERNKDEHVFGDIELSEDEKILLSPAFSSEDQEMLRGSLTLKFIEHTVEELFGQLVTISDQLPSISVKDLDIADSRAELETLKDFSFTANALKDYAENLENARALISQLRKLDSVYLNQVANLIEQQVEKNISVINGEIIEDPEVNVTKSRNDMRYQFDHIDRMSSSLYDLMEEKVKGQENIYGTALQQLDALCLFADIADHEGFSQVRFNSTGLVQLRNTFSIFKNRGEEETNDISLDSRSDRVQMLTGPNGSGKTFYEKGVIAAILMGLATGYAPASDATMPIFDGVIYLDRVVPKQAEQLSAFSQEIEYWKSLFALLETRKSVIIAADEAFSTTSPSYQAALTYGVVSEILQSPHFLLLSTHNHNVVRRIQDAQLPLINPYHFQFSVNDGKVQYMYKLQKGHETSHAFDVARTLQMPEEIVSADQ